MKVCYNDNTATIHRTILAPQVFTGSAWHVNLLGMMDLLSSGDIAHLEQSHINIHETEGSVTCAHTHTHTVQSQFELRRWQGPQRLTEYRQRWKRHINGIFQVLSGSIKWSQLQKLLNRYFSCISFFFLLTSPCTRCLCACIFVWLRVCMCVLHMWQLRINRELVSAWLIINDGDRST